MSGEVSHRHRRYVARFGRKPSLPIPRILDDDEPMLEGYECASRIVGEPVRLAEYDYDERDRVAFRIGARLGFLDEEVENLVCEACGNDRLIASIGRRVEHHLHATPAGLVQTSYVVTTEPMESYVITCSDPDCGWDADSSRNSVAGEAMRVANAYREQPIVLATDGARVHLAVPQVDAGIIRLATTETYSPEHAEVVARVLREQLGDAIEPDEDIEIHPA